MNAINDNSIISILKIGDSDNYLYNSVVDETEKEQETNLTWLIKFAYSFMMEELMKEVREKLEKKKQEQKKLEQKKQEEIQLSGKKLKKQKSIRKIRKKLKEQPTYEEVTDEEFIINEIFQTLKQYFPNIGNKYATFDLKREYKEELLKAFDGIDDNRDGIIDEEEFVKLYNKINPSQKPLNLNNPEHKKKIEELMHSAGDEDNNGEIDKVEFIIYMIKQDEAKAIEEKRGKKK